MRAFSKDTTMISSLLVFTLSSAGPAATSPAVPDGCNQEDTTKAIWREDERARRSSHAKEKP